MKALVKFTKLKHSLKVLACGDCFNKLIAVIIEATESDSSKTFVKFVVISCIA